MNFEEKQLEVIKMEIRRMVRMHGREDLPEKIADYVMYNCQPRVEQQEIVKEPEESKALVIDRVIAIITAHFGISFQKISSKSRRRELVYPRQVGIYMLCVKSHLPMRVIAEVFGGRDHSTAIHSRDMILDKMSQDASIKTEIKYLLKKI